MKIEIKRDGTRFLNLNTETLRNFDLALRHSDALVEAVQGMDPAAAAFLLGMMTFHLEQKSTGSANSMRAGFDFARSVAAEEKGEPKVPLIH